MQSAWTGYAGGREDVPLGGYAALLSIFSLAAGALYAASRRRWLLPSSPRELVLTGIAAFELARLVTRDAVTGALRAPFTEYVAGAGAGEVKERPRGRGLRRAIGELVTCPYCAGPWAATALVGGMTLAPRPTRYVRSLLLVSTVATFGQQLYAAARRLSR